MTRSKKCFLRLACVRLLHTPGKLRTFPGRPASRIDGTLTWLIAPSATITIPLYGTARYTLAV